MATVKQNNIQFSVNKVKFVNLAHSVILLMMTLQWLGMKKSL